VRIKLKCCFCGEAVEQERAKGALCSLALTTPEGESQAQWCHLDCFARAASHCDIYVGTGLIGP
jgi:hypothetical protein